MTAHSSIPERILRGLALWCLVQGTIVAVLSPDLLAWDARHEHVTLQQALGPHTHPWDDHHDDADHGSTQSGDTGFAPATSGSVSLALPLLPGAGLVLPEAPPPLLAAALSEAQAPPDSPLTIEPPPPRSLA
jgi:hypothetical protein